MSVRNPRRAAVLVLLTLPLTYMYLYLPIFKYHVIQRLVSRPHPIDLTEYLYPLESNISVNLVVASTRTDDISWTSRLRIPNLNVVRYVSDDPNAKYRPPVPNKGREALMYHTYLHDFYDNLPDISILIHPHEKAWHVDGALRGSLLFALSRLDLEQVLARGYVNLRTVWKDACPAWINTTKSADESTKQEEPFMRAAFAANFGVETPAPEILAGPCCSQFAVTRETVRRRPQSQYRRSAEWLVTTEWSDYIAGRTWEHMWPWLFREAATDCPVEWKALCRMYRVCFEDADEPRRFQELWEEARRLVERTEFLRGIWNPEGAEAARRRIREIEGILEASLARAVERGGDARVRGEGALGDIFVP